MSNKSVMISRLSRASCTLQIAGQDSGASHLLLRELELNVAHYVREARAVGANEVEIDNAIQAGAERADLLKRTSLAA